jgi:DNA helicase-2/ATP-dependent DNA helicase PcrA
VENLGQKQHPDFYEEIDRLRFTKKYMEMLIQARELDEESFKKSAKESLEGIDLKDSSLSYLNMLTNSSMIQRTEEEIRSLKKIYHKPYFARINYQANDKSDEEILYFGKASLFDRETQDPIIVDWRSPIANLYYDGRLGDVTYEAEGEIYEGNLSLKRQYIIEEGELKAIRDVDLTTTDELLQESLSTSSSNRLTDIVSTIQEEQNRIIRADLNKPIIVQGAAGSGKTTIALHRISYFIYTYAEYFKPEQLMILAPNNLFIDYISEVLPELGVDRILQMTFSDYVKSCISKKIKLTSPSEKLGKFIDRTYENPEMIQWISSFKGSLTMKIILDRYLEDILESIIPKKDFYLSKFKLYSAGKMRHLMQNEYTYLPYYRRLEKIKDVLQNYVRTEKKVLLKKVEDFYDEKIEKALYSTRLDPDKRKSYVTKVMDKKAELMDDILKQSRVGVQAYIRQIEKHDLIHYFDELFTDKDQLVKYAEDILDEDQIDFFYDYQVNLRKKRQFEVEDLASLLYLQFHLFGIKKELRARNVVIDEAQDYSYFQLYALKSALETDMFTIVGDLAQGIHSYRGLNDWSIVKEDIFPRATYTTLQKSYRTTVEIMQAANDILSLLPLDLPKVEPVVRHGHKPVFYYWNEEIEAVEKIKAEIQRFYSEGMKTIAVIGKTERECVKIEKLFRKHASGELRTQLLRENEEINQEDLIIVHSQLAKGLEFDVVLLFALDEVFELSEIELKLLYVAMTRPLHRLMFFGKSPSVFLLEHIHDDSVTIL